MIPGSRVEVFPNTGHLVMLEQSDTLAGTITEFLKG